MKSDFAAVDAQTRSAVVVVDAEVAVDGVQLLKVRIVVEPHRPHGRLCAESFKLPVPGRRQRSRNVRTEFWSTSVLVLMVPVLDRQKLHKKPGTIKRDKYRLEYVYI